MKPPSAKIAVTMGDPSGVGPELMAALVAERFERVRDSALLFCDRVVLERAFTQRSGERLPDIPGLVDRGLLSADQAVPGQPSEAGARAQVAYLEGAARAAQRGECQAIVTGPVSKTQCKRAGLDVPGQTELFRDRLGAERVAMMFCGPVVHVILATTHVPLAAVAEHLGPERLDEVIELGIQALRVDLGIPTPRIGVVGLNPHAGEGGLLGSEERAIVTPAIARARARHGDSLVIEGPLVPDHAFRPPSTARYHLLVAMYHDQALIPLKLLDFDRTVNVSVGLPVVRTSPDHGVAYDIAGTGAARPTSFLSAFDLAVTMAERRAGVTP